jgi:branched-chain amino acid transport system permease protein
MELLTQIIQQLINGLSLGGIYALIALGYTMVYGIVKLINFAHGDILMVGAYIAYFVLTTFGFTPWSLAIAFILAVVGSVALGVGIEATCYRPLRNAPRINALITAIGVSIILENLPRMFSFIGSDYRNLTVPQFFPTINIGDVSIIPIKLITLVVTFLLMVLLTLVVDYTKSGKAMRAVSFDMGASSLMGISVNKTVSFTFALGSALAGAGGVLYILNFPQLDTYMGIMPGLKAFVAAVLGGIGSIPGAMVGGLILGLAETFTAGFISSDLTGAVVFGILIIILMFKPSGILGVHVKEKV